MDFISGKLQACGVQTGYLLETDFTTDAFWKMFQKLVVLKSIFQNVYGVTAF